ncbi:MAG TPA: DNA polymerase I [Gammaproteobacteria bacterium]|nr:DNA polymerase I [Gammaproteobacteria bacterium]
MTNNLAAKPLILVDGSSYLYRAFHALPSLTNSKGFPTGAVYGVINMLRRLINDYNPELIAVVFDSKEKTFRETLYGSYKANRSAMPDELISQIKPIHEIIQALGLPLMIEHGVEADDVIGTLTKQAEQQGLTVLISTGDKDFAQLVTTKTTLINTMTNSVLNPQTVSEKFGVPPDLIIDYLTLVGDSIDNIPGVPQVGPKTAVKWLTEYGSLDQIVMNADKITGKVGENLRHSLEQLPLAKTLATIKLDVPLTITINDLRRKTPDIEKLTALYREFEFKSWLNELLEKSSQKTLEKYTGYETIFSEKILNEWIEKLNTAEIFSFDTETTSLNPMKAELVGMSFAINAQKGVYIPFAHDYENAPQQLQRDDVLEKFKPILENPRIKKIGHNIKYDLSVLANYGICLQGIAYDTMLESYILNSASNNHGMDSLALKYLGLRTIHYEDVAGKGAKQVTFNKVSIDTAAAYAAEDADVTLQLHHTLWPKFLEHPRLAYVLEEIEIPLIAVLATMERNGVLIDADKLKIQTGELEKRISELQTEAFQQAGSEFNINSPKQLQEILYCKLALPVLQKTPTGQPSTAENVLQELAADYPLPKLIMEYRTLSKLISTYTKRLPEQINASTQRIHTSYNQTGAATGRLSSSDPNLQNIPIRTAEGRRIRQAFIAPPNHQLISADYSQIELRIMAHISNDPALLKAFEQNLDIHKATAAEVLNIRLDQVTSEERRAAKAINFGLIYGMSAFGLAKQLGIDRNAAQDYIVRYFMRYPEVNQYMEKTRAEAHAKGYVETLWGRRLYLPDINSSQIMRQKAAERAAINAPLQGSAADIIKRAMISLHQWLQQNPHVSAKMIMQVHDELVFEVADDDVENMCEVIRAHMMKAADLKIPLVVDVGAGNNWDEASA